MTKLCGPQIFICEDTSKYPITALACTSSRLNLWSICRGLSLFHSCIETICMENYQTITSFVFISLRFLTASLLFHFDGGARSIPLYHIVILCLSQPRNVRRLPGPPVYTSFWGDGKPPWLGGPKAHSPHDIFIHAGFESHHFLFFPVHMEMGLRHATPSTHAHTI